MLLDSRGRAIGAVPKAQLHDDSTPLHLGLSCYVVNVNDEVLITRRSASKVTWPGTWTNACCGHPRPGETLREAVTRHLRTELALSPTRMTVAMADFAYRAEMDNGTVEHELCPVVVVEVSGTPQPNPHETDATEWISWPDLVARATREPASLSPWSVAQIGRLAASNTPPRACLDREDSVDSLLDVVPGHPHMSSPPETDILAPSRRRVDAHLLAFINARRDDVPEAHDAIAVLSRSIRELTFAGGKRLRPTFVAAGFMAGGGDPDRVPVDAAAAVEMLHSFALLHDDVMDRSAMRRGRPTAQHSLRALHRNRSGDAAWFGISASILAGDLAFVWADRLFDGLDDTGIPPERVARARALFSRLRTEVIAGQYLDLQLGSSPSASEPDALRIALLKSARYTATRSLQVGAALAGADEAVEDRLTAYGDAIGAAFQLRDDVLGLFGEPQRIGKSCADDLREGKRTLLMLRALQLTDAAGRQVLERNLGAPDVDDLDVRRCRDIVSASGALASVEAAIDMHVRRAVGVASTFESSARGALVQLAEMAAQRDR